MFKFVNYEGYRNDIDGLRAIAVISVIIFHLGFLKSGFLGVDVFFVISGYLITGIIYNECKEKKFSIVNFYVRRIRRIIPLVTFIGLIALLIGVFTMLPDDLENLAQSVFATNFFSNNILQAITTKDYWDVVNEYKPLMHTWSLGIEEQYYLFYPIIFLLLGGKRIKAILPTLIILTVISVFLYFTVKSEAKQFYYIPYRFFELSIGGVVAIIFNKKVIKSWFSIINIILLIIILGLNEPFISDSFMLCATVVTTCAILISANGSNKISFWFLQNKGMVLIGKLSFSLYMWHQLLLAFGRYFVFQELDFINSIILVILTFLLSLVTYYFVEQPFRDKKKISTPKVIILLVAFIAISTAGSLYIYKNAGVLKDIPELGISKGNVSNKMHIKYNEEVYKLDKGFEESDKLKVFVIGNSFARDWVNVLLESDFEPNIEVTYSYNYTDRDNRADEADVIFLSAQSFDKVNEYNLDSSKVWCVGTKNFGFNNGFFYNHRGDEYCYQRTKIENSYYDHNEELKQEWGVRYIDILSLVLDEDMTVPVFTPDCKFISQDCRHFTEAGAKYFSELIDNDTLIVVNKLLK